MESKYLAFLDILGFKDLIQNNELDYVTELYEKIEPSILYSMAVASMGKRLDMQREGKEDILRIFGIEETSLDSLVISDSIIIWTEDDHPNSLFELISIVKHHLYLSMTFGVPLRGAITVGELSIKTGQHKETHRLNSYTTILGKPLTNAFVLENKLNSSGCIIDDKCIETFNQYYESEEKGKKPISIGFLEEINFIKKYLAPMKNGEVKEQYMVNWTHYLGPRLTEQIIRDSFSMHNKNCNDWSVEEKIRNTVQFLNDTESDYIKFVDMMKNKNAI
jgi:hypothetical protein